MMAGAKNIAQLFFETFSAADWAADPEDTADALDELAVDEAKHYKAKITKWIKSALNAVSDFGFWYVMHVSHTTRSPLLHFYRWLCSKPRPGKMPIVELVNRRCELFHNEFNGLLSKFLIWTENAIEFSRGVTAISKASSEVDVVMLRDMAAMLLLQNASCFNRRVLHVYQRSFAIADFAKL